jgi:hypothetical protein
VLLGVANVHSELVRQELKLEIVTSHGYVDSLESIVQDQVRTQGKIFGELITLEFNY